MLMGGGMKISKKTKHLEAEKSERSKIKLSALLNNIGGCVYGYCVEDKRIHFINHGVEDIWGIKVCNVTDIDVLRKCIHKSDIDAHRIQVAEAIKNHIRFSAKYRVVKPDGEIVWVRENGTPTISENGLYFVIGVIIDITEYRKSDEENTKIKLELAHSRKLESIGQLSAGIAHEINTPSQYISDNIMFLNSSFDSLLKITNKIQALIYKDFSNITPQEFEDLRTIFQEDDMDFVLSEIPLAITQSMEGLQRVKKIIGAMKSFSHSNQGEMSMVDIVEAIESTATVCRSEWRYIADLKTNYSETSLQINCLRDEFNQVILNFIVNAAHAVEERYGKKSEQLGNIEIDVSYQGDYIQILIHDDGIGMSEDVKNRVFDPFFTTKDVGKGTGQGLSMAYAVIVEKLKGSIELESEIGAGTKFKILIPLT